MFFIQFLNEFHIAIESTKNIQFINSICYWQPLNKFIISFLIYIDKLGQNHKENVFTNMFSPTFTFKAMDIINHNAYQFTNSQMTQAIY
jgi:hypothetical protein